MITAIDTNVIVALWDRGQDLSFDAQSALDRALRRDGLVICAPVFAELLACPGRDEAFLDVFLNDTGITSNGISTNPSGALRVALFRRTLCDVEGMVILVLVVFLLTL